MENPAARNPLIGVEIFPRETQRLWDVKAALPAGLEQAIAEYRSLSTSSSWNTGHAATSER
jgi:hypothetical protein